MKENVFGLKLKPFKNSLIGVYKSFKNREIVFVLRIYKLYLFLLPSFIVT